jgi:hypothetical protein
MRRGWRNTGALLLALSSCRQLIGIEGAELDPASDGSAGAGLGGAPNTPAVGSASSSEAGGETVAGAPLGGADAGSNGAAGQAEAGDAGQGGSPEQPTLCQQYCTAVMSSCTAAFAVYTSYETCLSVCAALPQGKQGDRSGNSVSCRLSAALLAKDEVPHYCPVAGPGGNGVCGSNCEALCELRAKVCGQYGSGDVATCRSDCEQLQDLGNYSTALDVEQYGGPHVQCRLYHVSAAAAADAEKHCPHAAGAAPCQ